MYKTDGLPESSPRFLDCAQAPSANLIDGKRGDLTFVFLRLREGFELRGCACGRPGKARHRRLIVDDIEYHLDETLVARHQSRTVAHSDFATGDVK